MLRGVWGLAKDREKDDLHHALDATVIAAVNPRTIRLLTEFRKARETAPWSGESEFVNPDTGEIIKFDRAFPQPWKGFRKELLARLSENPEVAIDALKLPSYADNPPKLAPVFISRMPHRKMSGAIHKETIKGIQYDDEGIRYATQYVPLTSLTSSQLDELAADESDKFLVCEIRKRMKEFGNDAKKAFSEPLYKLKRNGENGPRVRRVKIIEKQPSGVPDIRYGIADNASMIRVDIFTKGGKFFIVPLYTKDIYAGIMPNKAITAYKPESEWPDMDESYLFLFSLYPYDLVKLINKKEEYFGYYRGTNRALGSIAISDPNNNLKIKDNIGAKTALKIEKYEVNLFGEFHLVREEKRRGLENCSHLESGEAED
jgi:CRISPR-associated endonuclease Csn1